jgi:hypothetical protein
MNANFERIPGFVLLTSINAANGQVLGPIYIRAGSVFSMTPVTMPSPGGLPQMVTALIATSPVAGTGFNGIVAETADMIAQLDRNAMKEVA